MRNPYKLLSFLLILGLLQAACNPDDPVLTDKIQIVSVRIGQTNISPQNITTVEAAQSIIITFNKAIDLNTLHSITLSQVNGDTPWPLTISGADMNRQLVAESEAIFPEGENFRLEISNELRGAGEEVFEGISYEFKIRKDPLELLQVTIDGRELKTSITNKDVPLNPEFHVAFSHDIPQAALEDKVLLNGKSSYALSVERTEAGKYTVRPNEPLKDYEKLNLFFSAGIGDAIDRDFEYVRYTLFTVLDSTPDFPLIPDEDLLTLVQEQTFMYFWDFGHPASGMARERNTSGNTVTSGGSGFGLMAMVVAVERGFITRAEALERWERIVNFLETADRFHGAWSHWINGNTGKVIPFSQQDNGGDLVETAFLVQGLLTVRQFLQPGDPREGELFNRIDALWKSVEWNWYTKNGLKQLYWHWSPEYEWAMNLPIGGHNETQIVYVLAAASPSFGIDKETYTNGYAKNGAIINGNSYFGIELPLGYSYGGPLFFAHYSYLGLDPRNLSDAYANYWEQNRAHSLINRAYCIANPKAYIGYSADCWGLTASDNETGYSAHSPTNDKGVITPTAALSSIPYTPEESLAAIRHFYYLLGDRLWGPYGFYDAFNFTEGWVAGSYIAIDQGPIICMIENYRTALLWDLFMTAPEIKNGLDILGFTY